MPFFPQRVVAQNFSNKAKNIVILGWDTIINMYQCEVGRAKLQQTMMVPCLKEVHCIRDAWTKLNVSPATYT